MENRVRRRAALAVLQRPPRILKNVMATRGSWEHRVRTVTEAFPKRFTFFHPVKCPGGKLALRPKVNGSKETYTCKNGSKQVFHRWKTPNAFFKHKYGRGGEFAQGLYAVLHKLGYKVRLVLGYWHGANALWVEIWHPSKKKWIALSWQKNFRKLLEKRLVPLQNLRMLYLYRDCQKPEVAKS